MLALSNKIKIDKQQILSHFGYCDDYEPSARITSLVNDYIENYHRLIETAYSYAIKDNESGQKGLDIIE